ncbi:hypothetical protein AUJ66_00065 [Candidatus Desantisbacteria bacterium CG1_02_38_46]|uniref:Zinc/iron-chelating domain-containing protein n=1 Tax=Candidatus Desantisbacteria bacterium CG1_02_38_46 TaxID=1817893 RepID=A0A1J4SH86_9BACT|nr:MAG: hypothetical protein AUJ66_00065 [Candidatus Desantisbacteria bacterium CG1_02_38_46]
MDLEKIKKLAKEKDEENWRFRNFLKGRDSKEIDSLVHKLYQKISKEIDCKKCGNCCKTLSPTFDKKDIEKLSKHLKISPGRFEKQYLIRDKDLGKLKIKEEPCPFLKDKICTVEKWKPQECREYPYLHKKDFTSRLTKVIDNYSVCPIVFNVYEYLKDRLLSHQDFNDFDVNEDFDDFG